MGDQSKVGVTESSARFESDDTLSLSHLREQIRDRHVRAAARKMLEKSMERNRAVLMINRQAAAVGVVALCGTPEESPLGPIYVTIESKEVAKIVDWLTAYEGGYSTDTFSPS